MVASAASILPFYLFVVVLPKGERALPEQNYSMITRGVLMMWTIITVLFVLCLLGLFAHIGCVLLHIILGTALIVFLSIPIPARRGI